MIGVPSLFEKNPRNRRLSNNMIPVAHTVIHEWIAYEVIPGVDVRVTVRDHTPVRLEVVQRPDADQKKLGIVDPWFRDCERMKNSKDFWLWEAAREADLSNVPDGEWAGEAIGENINRNSLDIEGHTIVFSSLVPWGDQMDGVLLPPEVGRTPLEFTDIQFYLATTPSTFELSRRDNIPIEGLIWWWKDTPVAQVRSRDFLTVKKAPNPDAELPPIIEREDKYEFED